MKLHLCCGSIYLYDYINCDVCGTYMVDLIGDNPNKTDVDNYFKDPFEPDINKRKRKETIVDIKMDILKAWPFLDYNVDEILMVSAFEHFEHLTEIPHIVNEAHRVLKFGGVWKFDFPDIKKQVDEYYGKDDEFLAELIYCNRKNMYSKHCWMYTKNTISLYLKPDHWSVKYEEVVKHDYPMQGVHATKV